MISGIHTPCAEAYALDKILNACNRLTGSRGQPAMESGMYVGETSEEQFAGRSAIGGMGIEIGGWVVYRRQQTGGWAVLIGPDPADPGPLVMNEEAVPRRARTAAGQTADGDGERRVNDRFVPENLPWLANLGSFEGRIRTEVARAVSESQAVSQGEPHRGTVKCSDMFDVLGRDSPGRADAAGCGPPVEGRVNPRNHHQ
jgi:hypothetical protein